MPQETIPQTNDLWNPLTNAAGEHEPPPPSPSGVDSWGDLQAPSQTQRSGGIDSTHINLLLGGGAALVVLGVVIVGFFLLTGSFGPSSARTFSLASGKAYPTYVKFEKGVKVQVWVNSQHDSDVDLFVYDQSGNLLVKDEADSKNCFVTFTPKGTQSFKLLVVNRIRLEFFLMERNRENRCTLKWEQGKATRS